MVRFVALVGSTVLVSVKGTPTVPAEGTPVMPVTATKTGGGSGGCEGSVKVIVKPCGVVFENVVPLRTPLTTVAETTTSPAPLTVILPFAARAAPEAVVKATSISNDHVMIPTVAAAGDAGNTAPIRVRGVPTKPARDDVFTIPTADTNSLSPPFTITAYAIAPFDDAVTTAEPEANAWTAPEVLTDTAAGLELLHDTLLVTLVMPSYAVNWTEPGELKIIAEGLTVNVKDDPVGMNIPPFARTSIGATVNKERKMTKASNNEAVFPRRNVTGLFFNLFMSSMTNPLRFVPLSLYFTTIGFTIIYRHI